MMRIAVVQSPNSNSERETILALERAGMQAHTFLWNEPKEKLADFHGFIITGHFSAEEHSRASAIAALDPIMQGIQEQSLLGKPVLGICKGAQILVEAGLVPGLEKNQLGMALADNKRMQQGKILGTGFYNAWVHMRLSTRYQWNAFTRHLAPKDILHAQYCNKEGHIVDEFPVNPNGSVHNIAAIANKAGHVMAMLPRPECTPQGDVIFKSMREYIEEGYKASSATLRYQPRSLSIKKYQAPVAAREWIVDLPPSDPHAIAVENALHRYGLPVKIKRAIHWEVQCDSASLFEKIKETGILFNVNKEKIMESQEIKNTQSIIFLVRAREDLFGQEKLELLKNNFDMAGVQHTTHSILWCVNTQDNDIIEQIIQSAILFNPYTHDCYYYKNDES